MTLLLILFFFLAIIGWVSYYTSASIYRSLKKKDNPNARMFQLLSFFVMFAILTVLGGFLFFSNLGLHR